MMGAFMPTLIPKKKTVDDPFTYRILCDGKLVDFSPTYEGIMSKYKRYAQDCLDGYSDRVSVIRIHPETNEEYVMFTYRRDEPFNNLSKPFKQKDGNHGKDY
jgi:hypothetical protein